MQPTGQPTRQPTNSPTTVLSETSDGNALCDFWSTLTSYNRTKLTNWSCAAVKNADGSFVNGPCTTGGDAWLGVTCMGVTGASSRVSVLALTSKGLGGSLPTSIGDLRGLTFIDFNTNLLAGSIPASLGALTGLKHVNLGNNLFSGSLPSTLGALTKLTTLGIYNNARLTGFVPASFCSLPSTMTLTLTSDPGLTCYPRCFVGRSGVQLDAGLTDQCGEFCMPSKNFISREPILPPSSQLPASSTHSFSSSSFPLNASQYR